MKRVFLAAAVALAVAACGAKVETNVTAFHNLSSAPRGQTFVMIPLKSQEGSLEFQTYAGMVASRLAQKGLVPTQQATGADYAVFIAYAIDEGRTSVSSAPVFGQTGGGTTTTTSGYVGRTPVYGSSYTAPTYGITGYVPVEDTVYGRAVKIVILDAKRTVAEGKNVVVYEATAASTGSSGNLNMVMAPILDAVFEDWPGKSGSTQRRVKPM